MTALSPALDGDLPSGEPRFELRHAIDGPGVDRLRHDLGRLMVAPRALRIECDRVTTLDPVAVALLWLLCRNLEQSIGTRIRLTGLGPELALRLRRHPLQDFLATGEEIFADPFASPSQSER